MFDDNEDEFFRGKIGIKNPYEPQELPKKQRVINLSLEKIREEPYEFKYKPWKRVTINVFGDNKELVEKITLGGPLPHEKEDEYKDRIRRLKEQETKYQIYKFRSFVQNTFRLSPFGGKYRAIGRLIAETEKWIAGRRVYEK